MADERYRKLLGIEPKGDVPTHYELLAIDPSTTDLAVIEEAYKSQMKKLQSNKNSKATAFLEYLKQELRTARLTLTNPERRKAYDESLGAEAVTDFKKFVEPLMALGVVPKNLFDMMIAKGAAAGLTQDRAREIVHELARAANATIQTGGPTAVASAPQPAAYQIPDDADPSATHADTGFGDSGEHVIGTGSDEETLEQGEDDPGSYSDERPTEPEEEVVAEAVDEGEPAFYDDAEDKTPAPLPGPRHQETVLKAPTSFPPRDRPPARDPTPVPAEPEPNPIAAKIRRGGFWDMADTMQPPPKAAPSPWARGGGKPGESGRSPGGAGASSPWSRQGSQSPSESGRIDPRIAEAAARASGSPPPPRDRRPGPGAGQTPDSVQSQRDRFRGQEQQRALVESKKKHNQGAKLARIASDLHESLAQYFPPTNGKQTITYQINGVSFEKVFDMEHKTFRDSLSNFEASLQKTDGLGGDDVDELRARLGQNVNLVKTYLEELRQVKLKRLQPLTKSDELRMWQTFVSSKRSARLSQTIDER